MIENLNYAVLKEIFYLDYKTHRERSLVFFSVRTANIVIIKSVNLEIEHLT